MGVWEIILGVATLLATGIAVYEWKGNREKKKKLEDLEEGIVLHSFKLKKAMDYYKSGEYKSCVEAFQGYSKQSEDYQEMFNAIKKIFWSETRKVFGRFVGRGWHPEMVAFLIMKRNGPENTEYPSFLLKLLELYENSAGEAAASFKAVVLLANGNYEDVMEDDAFLKLRPTNSKKANSEFRKCVEAYCRYQLANTV